MTNNFYSPHEDSPINPNMMEEDMNFQRQMYNTIAADIQKYGFDHNRYTKNIYEIKTVLDDLDGDPDKTALVLADMNRVDFEDIAFDPTFQMYIKLAMDISEWEDGQEA